MAEPLAALSRPASASLVVAAGSAPRDVRARGLVPLALARPVVGPVVRPVRSAVPPGSVVLPGAAAALVAPGALIAGSVVALAGIRARLTSLAAGRAPPVTLVLAALAAVARVVVLVTWRLVGPLA